MRGRQTFTATRKPGYHPFFDVTPPLYEVTLSCRSSLLHYSLLTPALRERACSLHHLSHCGCLQHITYVWHWRQGYLEDTFFIDLIQITAASSTYPCSDELGAVARSSKEMLVNTVSIIMYTKSSENQ